jgi:hypothetical protein
MLRGTLILLTFSMVAFCANVVVDCGAVVCGRDVHSCVDSSAAFQLCTKRNDSTIFVPAGTYLLRKTIAVTNNGPFSIVGEGWTSRLVWGHNGTMFDWPNGALNVYVSSFAVVGDGNPKQPNATAFSFGTMCIVTTVGCILVC